MAGNVYGLDLGTYEIKVYDKKKDRIWFEKNAIAVKNKKHILAAGNKAYEMFEKAPADVQVVFPMQDGVIARFDDMQYLLGTLLGTDRQFIRGAQYVIAVPTDVTEVEKKAFYDLVFHSEAKARSVRIVERGLADALGCGMDVLEEQGLFVVNFGGNTTELSVLSGGGMVTARVNGKHELLSLAIKPEAVDPDDVEMLSDMVVAAVNAAMKSAEEDSEKTMGKLKGGNNMPGLFGFHGR